MSIVILFSFLIMRSENCFVYVFKNYVFIVGLIIDGHILTSKMHFLHRQQRLGHCTVHENFGLYVQGPPYVVGQTNL